METSRIHKKLRAVHAILLKARLLAYEGNDTCRIASMLDDAEFLVSLLISGRDEPDRFAEHVRGVSGKYSELSGLAEEYAK